MASLYILDFSPELSNASKQDISTEVSFYLQHLNRALLEVFNGGSSGWVETEEGRNSKLVVLLGWNRVKVEEEFQRSGRFKKEEGEVYQRVFKKGVLDRAV